MTENRKILPTHGQNELTINQLTLLIHGMREIYNAAIFGEKTIDGMSIETYMRYIEEKTGVTFSQLASALNNNAIFPRGQNKLPDSVIISERLSEKAREIKQVICDTVYNSIKGTPFTIDSFRLNFNISYKDDPKERMKNEMEL